MLRHVFSVLVGALLVSGKLSGTVGPTTDTGCKKAKQVCNILEHGGNASRTADNGAAITAAWAACVGGGQVYIPPGDYGLATFVVLVGGLGVSINLEGIIYRTGKNHNGNLISITNSTDFEFYSATGRGAIQGFGYEFHRDGKYGPRMVRLNNVTNFSVHDLALVDSPAFFVSLAMCTNGELYNMIIRGAGKGGLDGIDVWGSNIWVHDVEVTNRDECVTIKSPANHILVESVFCNRSGGCSLGSLGAGTAISNIEYRNIYSANSNSMLLIKSNGGSGLLENATFHNFIGHGNSYGVNLDSAWVLESIADGEGVQYRNMTFKNWRGTTIDGIARPPILLNCKPQAPCVDLKVDSFNIWSESGDNVHYVCKNAFGSGACLRAGDNYSPYTNKVLMNKMDSYKVDSMPGELKEDFALDKEIPIPPIPRIFFPGIQPKKELLG